MALRDRVRTQAAATVVPHRVPLATTIQNRDETFDKDSRLGNLIAEKDPQSGEYWIEKRVGYGPYLTLAGNGLGTYNWNNDVYAVFGTTLYKNGVAFGTVDGSSSYVFTEMLGTGDGWMVLGNGVKAYYTDGTTLTEFPLYSPVYAGAFVVGSGYKVISTGTTDFSTIGGVAGNMDGLYFTATGLGDPLTTGQCALMATSIIVGVTYKINYVGAEDFTTLGASANTVGTIFTATAVGVADGTVLVPNFPSSFVKGWTYLDGTLYVMDANGRIYGTSTLMYGGIGGLDDPRLWDPLNLIVARSEPDGGVALVKHLTYVVALKQWTLEVFYDAGNATGSPLRPVPGALGLHGCASADSVQSVNETLLWMTANRKGSYQVARMDELRATIISTPPIERLLDQVDPSQVFSWSLSHGGHKLYGLTIKQSNITLVYDLGEGLWYHWTDANGNYWPIVSRTFSNTNKHLVQHETNGKLYLLEGDYEYPNDDGDIVPVDIYTPNFDAGVDRRKHLHVMRINADQTPGSKLFVRFSDDDYRTWTNFREIDLSNKRPMMVNCGTFYRRAWHFRHYANTPLRIKSIDLQLDIGTL